MRGTRNPFIDEESILAEIEAAAVAPVEPSPEPTSAASPAVIRDHVLRLTADRPPLTGPPNRDGIPLRIRSSSALYPRTIEMQMQFSPNLRIPNSCLPAYALRNPAGTLECACDIHQIERAGCPWGPAIPSVNAASEEDRR